MKKVVLILGLLMLGLTSKSQVLISIILGDKLNSPNLEFGLEGGYNWSSISELETKVPMSNFNLGFYFDFKVKPKFYFYTGVLVKSNLGTGDLTSNDLNLIGGTTFLDYNGNEIEGTYNQKLNYFLVPALAKYRHKSNFFIEGGPQFGLMYKSWIEFDSKVNGKEATIKEYNKEKINVLDIGGILGVGYKFKSGPGWSLGVKYYQGFTDVYKEVKNTKNSGIFVKLNIPIGAGKKKNEEQ